MEPRLFFSKNTKERPLLDASLNDLCMKWGTDKMQHPDKTRHGYALLYEEAFTKWRTEPIRMLEIGIAAWQFPYASFNVWLDYFTQADVWGMDNFLDGTESSLAKNIPSIEKILERGGNFVYATQAEKYCLDKFFVTLGLPFHLIIDDGSHKAKHMWTSLAAAWDYLAPGGEYYIEDISVFNRGNMEILSTFCAGVDASLETPLVFFQNYREPVPKSSLGRDILAHITPDLDSYYLAPDQRGDNWLLLLKKKGTYEHPII